jgi:hypothetical protein
VKGGTVDVAYPAAVRKLSVHEVEDSGWLRTRDIFKLGNVTSLALMTLNRVVMLWKCQYR